MSDEQSTPDDESPKASPAHVVELATHRRFALVKKHNAAIDRVHAEHAGNPTILRARVLALRLEHFATLYALPDADEKERRAITEWVDDVSLASGPYGTDASRRWADVLSTVRRAAQLEWWPAARDDAETRETRVVLKDGAGRPAAVEFRLTDEEAATMALERLSMREPHLARAIPVRDLAAILPVWRQRKANTGHAGKDQTIDHALIELGANAGLDRVTPDAMRKMRARLGRLLAKADR
ncbi:MAG: hypothetical protein ACLP1X_05720 [Polyangiaceae bacterium]